MRFICTQCDREYPEDTSAYQCECGGLLSCAYEHEGTDRNEWSLWRYGSVLPPFSDSLISSVSMGEGATPLFSLEENLLAKGEYYMPTLSFKDRGAVMLASHMKAIGVRECAIDSSGNAATAVAAYCARSSISCEVFVPAATGRKKVEQIAMYGAQIHLIEGSREASGKAVREFVQESGAYYASHIYNPLFFEGTKTYLYEIREQLGGSLPDILIVPVGNGTLLTGVYLALREMHVQKVPLIVAVQASACAPLSSAYNGTSSSSVSPTLAEGIAIAEPARLNALVNILQELKGLCLEVSEQEIESAHTDLAARGMSVEFTSAVNYAGYRKLVREYPELGGKKSVLPLCGAGLKSL